MIHSTVHIIYNNWDCMLHNHTNSYFGGVPILTKINILFQCAIVNFFSIEKKSTLLCKCLRPPFEISAMVFKKQYATIKYLFLSVFIRNNRKYVCSINTFISSLGFFYFVYIFPVLSLRFLMKSLKKHNNMLETTERIKTHSNFKFCPHWMRCSAAQHDNPIKTSCASDVHGVKLLHSTLFLMKTSCVLKMYYCYNCYKYT